jgi:hypothetical protein
MSVKRERERERKDSTTKGEAKRARRTTETV